MNMQYINTRNRTNNEKLPNGTLSEIIDKEDELNMLVKILKDNSVRDTSSHQIRRLLNFVKKEWRIEKGGGKRIPLLKNKFILAVEYGIQRRNINKKLGEKLIEIVKDKVRDLRDVELFRDFIMEIPAAYATKK